MNEDRANLHTKQELLIQGPRRPNRHLFNSCDNTLVQLVGAYPSGSQDNAPHRLLSQRGPETTA